MSNGLQGSDQERVAAALKSHGYQSQSYNVLTGDKRYYFSDVVPDSVVAFVVIAGVALVAGDPICSENDIRDICYEFVGYCEKNGWRCAFQAVTPRTLEQLQYIGFGFTKIGEEPFIDLDRFSLVGGKFRDLRRDIRRAQADGIKVIEYSPSVSRDAQIEDEMNRLSIDWQQAKGSGEFGFLVGKPALDDPGDRKYFLAVRDDHIESFCVCTPIYARNSIYFDLLRRKRKPLRGTVELLITESFKILRDQEYEWASLGTAPLSGEHTDGPEQGWFIELAMNLAFDRLGYFYSFKPVYEFKEQFGPHRWEPRYLAYYPPRFHPIIVYALLKAYDPSAMRNLSLKQVEAAWEAVKWIAGAPADAAVRIPGLTQDGAKAILRLINDIPRPPVPSRPGLPRLSVLPGLSQIASVPGLINSIRKRAQG